jgi:signal transduction histidine kinase
MQEVKKVYREGNNGSNWLKNLFIHDISNLFHIISNSVEFCESLLRGETKKEDLSEYFQMIAQQLTRGKKLIRNVRNLSDLEEYEMPLEPVELISKLRNAIEFTRISYPKKEIETKIISDCRDLYVMANELLSEVFENILVNSINYNRNKLVKLEVRISKFETPSKNYVKIEFKDNGIGIDDARKEVIFQGTHMKSRHSKGMGIGLSLVAKLIVLYGGEIWVEDRIKGDSTKGSNFVILIPLTEKSKVMFDD